MVAGRQTGEPLVAILNRGGRRVEPGVCCVSVSQSFTERGRVPCRSEIVSKTSHIFLWNNITLKTVLTQIERNIRIKNIVFPTRQPFFAPSRGFFFFLDYTCASIYYTPPPSDFVCLVRETRFWCVCVAGWAQGLRPSSAAAKTE